MADFWIRVHANLAHKPVSFRAADALGVKRAAAIGHLVMFWGAVSQHCEDGHVAQYPDAQLEAWASWEGTRGKFAKFIREQHLDESGIIREWDEYGGQLRRSRERNRAKVARWREQREARNPDVTVTETVTETVTPPSRNGVMKRNETKRNETIESNSSKPLSRTAKKPQSVPVENWVAALGDWWVAEIGAVNYGQLGKVAKDIHRTRGPDAIKAAARRYFGPNGKQAYKSLADFFATFAQWDKAPDAPTPIRALVPQAEAPSDRLRRMGAL